MSLLWTAVVLCVGMIFGIWLTKIILPTGKLLIDRTKDNKNVMTFSLGSLDPDELVKHDYIFTMFWENGWQAGVKRVTVKNTQIIGHDQNDSASFTTSSALKLNQRYFVLRRVYGV